MTATDLLLSQWNGPFEKLTTINLVHFILSNRHGFINITDSQNNYNIFMAG